MDEIRTVCTRADQFRASREKCRELLGDSACERNIRSAPNIEELKANIQWIGQEMGRLKTQDQSILQQFDNIKKTVDQICEQTSVEEEGSDSQKEHRARPMAQRVRTRNLSDSSATYDSERSQTKDGESLSQEYHGRQRDSSEGRHALQRRETLATFHQHREGGAVDSVQISRRRWRKKEHIYENLDEILEDLKLSTPALDAALRQQPRTRRTKPHRRESGQERESQSKLGMLRPCYHSADKIPTHHFPALSRNPSPSAAVAQNKPAPLQGPSPTADVFLSLQSADSGYMSSERALTNTTSQLYSDKPSSVPLRHFPSAVLPPPTDLRSLGAPVTGVSLRECSTGARKEHRQQQQQHVFTHRRQESSPATFQRDFGHQPAAVNSTGLLSQPIRSDRALGRNNSPKSILKKAESAKSSGSSSKKAGNHSGAKHQKSKTGGAISFLATLNKVSGTESVSDFDFQPTNPPAFVQQVSPLVMQSAPNIDRPSFYSHSQPQSDSQVSPNCESYIGLIGPAYQHQLVRPKGPSVQHVQDQRSKSHVTDERRKESVTARKSRDSSGTKSKGGEEKHRQNLMLSLSQPGPQDDFDDDTLVLYKGKSPSYDDDDTLVMYNRRHAKKRETVAKDSQAVPRKGNAVKDSHISARSSSGTRDPKSIPRRESGSRDPHAVSRRDSGSRDPHAILRRESGSRDPHAISRRDSGSRDSSAAQKSRHHSRQEHHYGPGPRNHMYGRSEGRQQPKPLAAGPAHPVMEETWC